jgi:tight adherence protein C
MSGAVETICCFLFVWAFAGASLLMFRWYAGTRLASIDADLSMLPRDARSLVAGVLRSMFFLGELAPQPAEKALPSRSKLLAAGYRQPQAATVFAGIKVAAAVSSSLLLGWCGLLVREDLFAAGMLAICGAGIGHLLPDRILDGKVRERAYQIERALPAALDLMVLSVEAGQSLDNAISETARELRDLYPELSSEFSQAQLELRAGRSRSEVIFDLGQRTASQELKKLSTVLLDSDRFGSSLGPALRTHARYLRSRRMHAAQEQARKLGVKLIFPVFFLIMPTVFVVTLGPAILQLKDALAGFIGDV